MRTGLALGLALAGTVAAQNAPSPLKDITKVVVIVDIGGKVPAGLTSDRLQTLTELKLRTAGLRVVSWLDQSDPGLPNPSVEISVTSLEIRVGSGGSPDFAVALRVRLREHKGVTSPTNGAPAPLELWHKESLHVVSAPTAARTLESEVSDALDILANEWLKANPRHAAEDSIAKGAARPNIQMEPTRRSSFAIMSQRRAAHLARLGVFALRPTIGAHGN